MEQALWTVLDLLAPVLAGAVGYAVVILTGVIRARIRNEVASGLLSRLTESVADAVLAVSQQRQDLLAQYKAPSSDGGRKLTAREASLLRAAAMQYVKSYWGPKGMRELAGILAGGVRDKDDAQGHVNRVIESKVEAEVARLKRRTGTIITDGPFNPRSDYGA